MFDELWSEIQDMQAEIFDFGDVNDDIPSVLKLTDEDINQFIDEKKFDFNSYLNANYDY
jgi:hypothetical protein